MSATVAAKAATTIRAKFDLAVIGGGIVGLATARQLVISHPKLKVCVLEKEQELASHQSKRNSGVVHCGVYYKKGSLKSRFCIRGAKLVKQYCLQKGLPYYQCGKLIVATNQDQLSRLKDLFANAKANKIEDIQLLNLYQIKHIQPGLDSAVGAIWSPNTAIVDWQQVALSYAKDFKQLGGTILTEFTASDFKRSLDNKSILISSFSDESGTIEVKSAVNCAGLYSNGFVQQTGNNEHPKVVPFKGRYFLLGDRLAKSIRTNIYPVPDPKLPFLGVHITPRLDGSVLVGPTATITPGYEHYERGTPVSIGQLYNIFFRSGLRKMLLNKDYQRAGILELRKLFSKKHFAQEVQELLPDLSVEDLVDTNFCGIRAQVVSEDGHLIDDFLIESGLWPDFNRIVHLRNCPSPAATSSLAIAERVVNILEERII